ncbi:hypothetical protein AB0G00_35140 [Nocardia salmonicida]|uniref:hypothetical protein n=1 Tax=Nocardia salmonicida TaxID=53431 RepID=UPI0033FA7A5C
MSSEQNPPNSIDSSDSGGGKTPRSKTRRARRDTLRFQLSASTLASIHRTILPLAEPAITATLRTVRALTPSVPLPPSITPVVSLPAASLPVTSLFLTPAVVLPFNGFTEHIRWSLPALELTAFTERAGSGTLHRSLWPGISNTVFSRGLDMSGVVPTSAQLHAMIPRIDLGYADQIAAVVGQLQPTLMSVVSTQNIFADLHESVSALLGNWNTLTRIGHHLAERGLRAAEAARAAAIRGERDAVAAFARTWLGIKKALDWIVDAVIGALLENSWLDHADEDPATALDTLRKETTAQRRGTQNLWDRKVHHRHIALLDEPVTANMTRADLLVGPDVRAFGRYDDPRVLSVLDQLSERDRQIADAYGRTASWDEAAAACGATAEQAESVRRKLKYRGKEFGRESAAGNATNNDAG